MVEQEPIYMCGLKALGVVAIYVGSALIAVAVGFGVVRLLAGLL